MNFMPSLSYHLILYKAKEPWKSVYAQIELIRGLLTKAYTLYTPGSTSEITLNL